MADSPVFVELSSSLSEQERRELLQKIHKSLSLNQETEESIFKKEYSPEEKEVLIKVDIDRSSWLKKLIIWFKSIVSGKAKKEIFLDLKIASLKSEIQRKSPGITGFETRNLYPKTAELFFKLYSVVYPLVPFFSSLWKKPRVFEQAYTFLLEQKVPNVKRNIKDFITIDEMEGLFSKSGLKNVIVSLILNRISAYVDSISENIFLEIEKQIMPLYYLKDVVFFPFRSFFTLFHFAPVPDDKSPVFKTASAMLALEYLEKMYYALYSVGKVNEPFSLEHDFAKNLTDILKSEDQGEKIETDEDGFTAEALINSVRKIFSAAKNLGTALPLAQLIKYFRKDPYYHLLVYMPKLYLREFYLSMLKLRILTQFDRLFPEIHKLVVEKKIMRLFESEKLEKFHYYRKYVSLDYKKLGLPFFTHIKSLNLLYNYIKIYYKKNVQNLVQIISRSAISQNRITLNRLLLLAAAMEDLESKIRQFDLSLSPDGEDGKLFQRLRSGLAADTTQQRLYRNLVIQKDREVKEIIGKGKDTIMGMKKIFDELVSNTTESIKTK
ncbi:MAG: DUF5312 family protein, partial [Spirochaetota bacterium]